MKNLILILILFVISTNIANSQTAFFDIGLSSLRNTQDNTFVKIGFTYENFSLFILSNTVKGSGTQSNKKKIPKKAVLLDKKNISGYGIGYKTKVYKTAYLQPFLAHYLVSDIYQDEISYIKGNKTSFVDIGINVGFDMDKITLSLGTGIKTNFNFNIGIKVF